MKKLKAFISVFMALMIFAMPCIPAYAQTYEIPDDIIIDESVTEEEITDEITEEETTEEDTSEEITDGNESVAIMYLCSDIDLFPFVGHCWIYVENLSDSPITVGLYEVPEGQGVSVGSFSFSVMDGWGLYYNLEGWRENRDDTVKRARYVSTELDAEKLEKLTDSLTSYPNYWGPVANCSTFAFSIWNSVTGDFYFSLLIPAIAHLELIIGGAKKGDLEMYYPTEEQVLRQRGIGNDTHLEPVGSLTLR